MRKTSTFLMGLAFCIAPFPALHGQSVGMPKEQLTALTPEWKGERFPDGRPKVSDDVLERMKNLSLEEAWAELRKEGYLNQYAGNFSVMVEGEPIIGRALTAQFMPKRVAVEAVIIEQGKKDGRTGRSVSWAIDALSQGDVYVADSYGKVDGGPIIGDNFGVVIHEKSGNGVVFNGTIRDVEGLLQIEGFNAYHKGYHPSHQVEMMLTGINVPIRIDEATVMPGDIVVAKFGGVLFIPAHLAEGILLSGETKGVIDSFRKGQLEKGEYTLGEIYSASWSDAIKDEFRTWMDENPDQLPMPRADLEAYLEKTGW